MVPYADAAAYEERYGEVEDAAALTAALAAASRTIDAEFERYGEDAAAADPERLSDVCLEIAAASVERAHAEGIPFGATSWSQGAIGITESVTLGNPYGAMFVTKAQRAKLGLGEQEMGFCDPWSA